MNLQPRPKRLYLLWFLAAALAFAAAGVSLYRLRMVDWTGVIIGGACLLMGLVSARRARKSAMAAPGDR